MEKLIKPGERVDELQIKDLKVIQRPKGFCFGIDAVLLANFVELKRYDQIIDLGTGTGIIPILMAGKSIDTTIKAIEIQKEVAEMADRSVRLNKLENRIEVMNIDLKETSQYLPVNTFDVVTANPPYMHPEGLLNPSDHKAISRHEICCTLEDVIQTASKMLKHHGRFFMVHRPQRLVDIMACCRQYKLEPKRLRFVHPRENQRPNLLLMECRKAAKPELIILEPLTVYREAGKYTDEIYKIYQKTSLMKGGETIE